MFERWYVLEAGASMLRLYDPKEDLLIRFPTCYLEEDGRVIAYGNEALQSILHPNIHRASPILLRMDGSCMKSADFFRTPFKKPMYMSIYSSQA